MSRRAALDAHLARSSGIVTRAELVQLGYTEHGADDLVRRRVLLPEFPGVYRAASWPPGLRSRLLALCRRNDSFTISHTTAGQEFGIRGMSDPRVHVLVPNDLRPELDRVVVHRCRSIGPDDVVERNGLRFTSPARTLFDASSVIGPARTESALEFVLHEELATLEAVTETFVRLALGGRPGSVELGQVLRSRPNGVTAVESGLELRVVRALRDAGLPEPVRQFPVTLPSGRSIRLDLAYPQWMIDVEVDHSFWHTRRVSIQRDHDRDRELTVIGWRIVRLTEEHLGDRLVSAIADVKALTPLHPVGVAGNPGQTTGVARTGGK